MAAGAVPTRGEVLAEHWDFPAFRADPQVLQEQAAYYDDGAPQFEELWYGRHRATADQDGLAQLAAAVEGFAHGDLLEVACGTGRWTQVAARRARVVATDASPRMLQQTAQRLRDLGLTARLERADAASLPFPERSFDRCLIGFLISHLDQTGLDAVVAEAGRVLRPGGTVMALDTRRRDGAPVHVLRRQLGTRSYRVLKVFHDQDSLRRVLGPHARLDSFVPVQGNFVARWRYPDSPAGPAFPV
jgi:demethylmenaquinone methyltransferase/2-methoxy-6-polyprenyl-1,4-benzoquinol methylase